ncbi:hypothetical protein GAS22_09240 [Bacteroides uniformis]|nr:hypothetical protein GAS22_09240 [Bacteroides uniformis]KAB3942653.1 hypothetical protein GAS23_08295 [Bacteroides uniformis]KAB3947499.1 hypothetical protein GAS33_08585 [Bacteroides uniformis]KAB3964434.1 hypothetical protein GAS28_07440 [Bacteroides uniformis]KAB3971956.1 hypothetical protein GAS02_19850 [Bacteroides uniformis]
MDVANPAAFIEKAETETRLKRHTPAPGMPHVSVPNATCQRSECHTSARPKCGIYPREVWHFNPLSVAFQPAKCGISTPQAALKLKSASKKLSENY